MGSLDNTSGVQNCGVTEVEAIFSFAIFLLFVILESGHLSRDVDSVKWLDKH